MSNKKQQNLTKDELKEWHEKIRVSRAKFEPISKDYDTYHNYYVGKHDVLGKTDIEGYQVIVNMVYANISTILPSIVFNNPRIYITAKKSPTKEFDTVRGASFAEILINYYYEELNIKREVRRCVFDALLCHWGVMQVGFTTKTEKVEGDEDLIINELIQSESPFAVRVSPKDLLVDSEGKDHLLNDAEWISFRRVKKLDDLKRDPSFKNTKNLKSNTKTDRDFDRDFGKIEQHGNSDIKGIWDRVEYEEVWDKRKKRVYGIVSNQDFTSTEIYNKRWPQELEGFPVETIYFNENPDEQFPLPDIKIYKRQQDELNILKSLQLIHINNLSKQMYTSPAGAFDMSELEHVLVGQTGGVAISKTHHENPLNPIKRGSVAQDLLMAIRDTQNNISFLSSTADFERGGPLKGTNTATEAALQQQGITIQRDDRQQTVEDFNVRIVRKMFQILQQAMPRQEISLNNEQFENAQTSIPQDLIKIVGQEGMQQLLPWINASKEDIKGEYNFRIEVGSMIPVNKQSRKQDIVQLIDILQQYGTLFAPREVIKRAAEVFEERDIEKLLKPEQQVQQEQQQAKQAAQAAQEAETMPKLKVDMAKTQMKSQTAVQVQGQKSEGDLRVALINALSGGSK